MNKKRGDKLGKSRRLNECKTTGFFPGVGQTLGIYNRMIPSVSRSDFALHWACSPVARVLPLFLLSCKRSQLLLSGVVLFSVELVKLELWGGKQMHGAANACYAPAMLASHAVHANSHAVR